MRMPSSAAGHVFPDLDDVNSGNSNAFTGKRGWETVRATPEAAAAKDQQHSGALGSIDVDLNS